MIKFEKDSTFIVTGASNGIGKAISELLVSLGANVLGIARNKEKLSELKSQLGHNFNYNLKDLSKEIDLLPQYLEELAKEYGKFNGIILCAGIQETKTISSIKYDKSLEIFDVNYHSQAALIKGFVKKKVSISDSNRAIVYISSITSNFAMQGIASYSASKAAMDSFVKTSALEFAKKNIRINSINSGHILTDLLTKDSNFFTDEYLNKLNSKYPLGLGSPEDVANLTAFLLSDKSKWMTGNNITLDGGASINFLP